MTRVRLDRQPLYWGGSVPSFMLQQSPKGKDRTGVGAIVGVRETVPSLKVKVGEALNKHNLKDRVVMTTLHCIGMRKQIILLLKGT